MKKIFTLIIVSALAAGIHAQSLVNSVVASAGGFNDNGTISLSWTLGEIAVTTLTSGNYTLTQGFQQSWDLGVKVEEVKFDWSVQAYPNPVKENLNIKFTLEKPGKFSIEIMDITGKKILSREAQLIDPNQVVELDMSQYKHGIYLLQIFSEDQKLHRVYKIRKE